MVKKIKQIYLNSTRERKQLRNPCVASYPTEHGSRTLKPFFPCHSRSISIRDNIWLSQIWLPQGTLPLSIGCSQSFAWPNIIHPENLALLCPQWWTAHTTLASFLTVNSPCLSTSTLCAGQHTISCVNYANHPFAVGRYCQCDGPGIHVITAGLLQLSPVRNRWWPDAMVAGSPERRLMSWSPAPHGVTTSPHFSVSFIGCLLSSHSV